MDEVLKGRLQNLVGRLPASDDNPLSRLTRLGRGILTHLAGSSLQGQDLELPSRHFADIFESLISPANGGANVKDKPAVYCGETVLSFREINTKANLLGRALLTAAEERLSRPTPPVIGLCVSCSEKRVIALLAIFKLRATYLPLDDAQPQECLQLALNHKPLDILLTTSDVINRKALAAPGLSVLQYERLLSDLSESEPDDNFFVKELPYDVPSDPVAACVFSAGTTAAPKCVEITNKNLLNRILGQCKVLPVPPNRTTHASASIAFVNEWIEICCCLLQGSAIIMLPPSCLHHMDYLQAVLKSHDVTRITLAPAMLKSMLTLLDDRPDIVPEFNSVTSFIVRGDVLPVSTAMQFFDTFPRGKTLLNFYGLTETSGDVLYDCFSSQADVISNTRNAMLSIGRPFPNANCYVLSDTCEAVDPGTVGEICISGPCVTIPGVDETEPDNCHTFPPSNRHHYRRRPYGNRRNPYSVHENHEWLHLTGDRALILNGKIIFMGRRDDDVTIQGYSLNLRNMEHKLAAMKSIDESMVMLTSRHDGEGELVAFAKARRGSTLSEADVVRACQALLPEHIVPTARIVREIPLRPDGKIDAQQLLRLTRIGGCHSSGRGEVDAPAWRPDGAVAGLAGGCLRERVIAIIAASLGIRRECLKDTDNFFQKGGDSLNAMHCINTLRQFGYRITVGQFVSSSSINDVVALAYMADLHQSEAGYSNGASVGAYSESESSIRDLYFVQPLNVIPRKEGAIHLLAVSFTQNNPVEILAGTSVRDFQRLCLSIWRPICRDNLSVGVVEKSSGHLKAVSICADLQTELRPDYVTHDVAELYHQLLAPVKHRILAEGRGPWLYSFLSAVDASIVEKHRLLILEMMQEAVICTAQSRGFVGILSLHSHPATTELEEKLFGYEVANDIHLRSWQYNGVFPFGSADDRVYAKCLTKLLR